MTKIIEHVVCPEGKFWRETRIREEIDPAPAMEKAYSKKVQVRLPNVLNIPDYGKVGMCYDPNSNSTFWSVPIQFINLRCEFRPIEDKNYGKVVVPTFIYSENSKEVILVKWPVSIGDMSGVVPRIILLIQNKPLGPGDSRLYTEQQWVFAFDGRKNVYQLPTANLYDHLTLCTGDYDSTSTTHQECIQKALTQFENSKWNNHLYAASKEEATSKFFRFLPEKDSFTPLAINSDNWTKLCQKRSVTFTEFVV